VRPCKFGRLRSTEVPGGGTSWSADSCTRNKLNRAESSRWGWIVVRTTWLRLGKCDDAFESFLSWAQRKKFRVASKDNEIRRIGFMPCEGDEIGNAIKACTRG